MTDPAESPRRGGRFGWTVALLALAFGAGMVGSPWFESQVRSRLPGWAGGGAAAVAPTSGAAEAQVKALEARLAAIEQAPASGGAVPADMAARLAALEASRTVDGAGAATLASDLGPMNDRLAQIELRIRTLETAVQTANSAAAQVGAFQGQLMTLQSGSSEQAVRLRALANLVPLRRALEAGTPASDFVEAIATALPAGSGDVVALRQAAVQPLTLAQVQRDFRARQQGTARTEAAHDESWLSTAMDQARSLIGGASAPSAAAESGALGQAQRLLNLGDVAGAARILRTLKDRARYDSWLVLADRYVASRAALLRVETALARQAPSALVPMTPAAQAAPVR